MCGILGAITKSDLSASIDKGLAIMKSRGPDGRGIFRDKSIYLAHTRLSIIDLSSDADQPMVSSCGRYVIVFNGEIYNYKELRRDIERNYRFRTKSDTEVILAYFISFGASALDYLRGMFAFAIWDKVEEELFIARDRLGVKPLYFTSSGDDFKFASRPQALCAMLLGPKRAIDRQALRYFLEAGYVPAPYSIFEGISKLEPGHYLTISRQGIRKVRYWSSSGINIDQSLAGVSENVLLDELDSLVAESVRLRLVSDVPIGAFLSGGVDSSLVAAYMSKYTQEPVRTFTIGFREKSFDESRHAAAVAAQLGTAHTCEMLSVDDLLELMPTFIIQYDEPFFDYSAFPVMAVSRLARRSVTVSLSGDGGDEAFGGYHYYHIMNQLERMHRLPQALRTLAGASLQLAPAQRLRWIGRVLAANGPAPAYAFMRGVIKDASNLMQPSLLASTQPLAHLFVQAASILPSNLSYAEMAMRLDLAYTLPDDYLQKVDVGSMAFSLEARDPLLDHKIIEWAAKLPLSWKMRGSTNKYLLRKLAYRYIPQTILDRPKMGFSVPMAQWLRGGLRAWGERLLSDNEVFEALELDGQKVRSLWDAHQSRQLEAHTVLWSVLVILQFYRSQFQA